MNKTPAGRERSSDPTRMYLRDVSKNPLLTHDEEIQLSQQIENSKRGLVLCILDVPHSRDKFLTHLQQAQQGVNTGMLAGDVNDVVDEQVTANLAQVCELINQYQATGDADVREQIAEAVTALPLKLAFFDELTRPITTVVRELVNATGAYLRFAQSQGIKRETFLANYRNSKPAPRWRNFVSSNLEQVTQFEQQIEQISNQVGVPLDQLDAKVAHIKTQSRLKDEAVERMLKCNLRLVVSVAKRYINVSPTPLLDLVQEGNIGLLKAIEKFNWRLGFRFSTYATWWIKQCVLKALNEQHRIIRVPSHMTDLVKRVSRAKEEFSGVHGHDPSSFEISEMLNIDKSMVDKVWTVAQGTISLETPIGSEESQNLASVIEDMASNSPFDRIAEVDVTNAVAAVLGELTAKEERVIRMRFGIGMDKESTLEDIGQRFNVTRERVRQIEFKALSKLKDPQLAQRIQAAFE
jgi:RNA polymerase primary sigma factor